MRTRGAFAVGAVYLRASIDKEVEVAGSAELRVAVEILGANVHSVVVVAHCESHALRFKADGASEASLETWEFAKFMHSDKVMGSKRTVHRPNPCDDTHATLLVSSGSFSGESSKRRREGPSVRLTVTL